MKPLFIYLACPYTHDDPDVILQRFYRVNKAAGVLMDRGYVVFSPITHSHTIEVAMERVKPWDYWRIQDFELLRRSDALFVLMLDGWRESVGVSDEINYARELNLPITYIDPKDLDV